MLHYFQVKTFLYYTFYLLIPFQRPAYQQTVLEIALVSVAIFVVFLVLALYLAPMRAMYLQQLDYFDHYGSNGEVEVGTQTPMGIVKWGI